VWSKTTLSREGGWGNLPLIDLLVCLSYLREMQHTSGFLKLVKEAKSKIKECTVADIAKRFERGDKFHFIDTREDDEWRAGHAKGAIHIGKGVLERDVEQKIPEKNADIVLYCGGGFRSALAAESLQRMGYTNVISMDGGMKEWRNQGLPEEKG
jgi:rhodanese-related sulfurtransferase